MATQTFLYRVRPGQRLPHNGEVLEAGETVSLTRAVAAEVRHLVEAIDADGNPVDPPTPLQLELEARPAHEHEGILQRRRGELAVHLVDLQDIAARTKATADAAAGEVTDLERAIEAIDVQLASPTVSGAAAGAAAGAALTSPVGASGAAQIGAIAAAPVSRVRVERMPTPSTPEPIPAPAVPAETKE